MQHLAFVYPVKPYDIFKPTSTVICAMHIQWDSSAMRLIPWVFISLYKDYLLFLLFPLFKKKINKYIQTCTNNIICNSVQGLLLKSLTSSTWWQTQIIGNWLDIWRFFNCHFFWTDLQALEVKQQEDKHQSIKLQAIWMPVQKRTFLPSRFWGQSTFPLEISLRSRLVWLFLFHQRSPGK